MNNILDQNTPSIRELIEKALEKLYDKEYNSLINLIPNEHVGERACVFRFALYFVEELNKYDYFNNYYLDCEYNRYTTIPKRNTNAQLIVPDLIIHQRGNNNNNLAVLEFKGWWNNNQIDDEKKIKEMISPNGIFRYKEGYTILLNKISDETSKFIVKPVRID